jgi:hypothetical protein
VFQEGSTIAVVVVAKVLRLLAYRTRFVGQR